MAQINRAMTLVDQVTQRNASASEELASTAEEMASQAEALQQTIAFFKTDRRPRRVASDAAQHDAAPSPSARSRSPPPRAAAAPAAFADYTHF